MRRAQDSVHPSVTGHGDVMVLSPENEDDNIDPHPYWYARVLGIYHANVRHTGPTSKSREPKKMEFLFVRWFGRDSDPKPGWYDGPSGEKFRKLSQFPRKTVVTHR
jgi:hypothetical protein